MVLTVDFYLYIVQDKIKEKQSERGIILLLRF